ncbi:hypothetical protein ABG067_006249 [Albugo candida]
MSDTEMRESMLFAVGTICEMEDQKQCERYAETSDTEGRRKRPTTSKETLTILTDVLMRQAQLMATELRHFAHHANRKVIKSEDVLLCARRQPQIVHASADSLSANAIEENEQETQISRP